MKQKLLMFLSMFVLVGAWAWATNEEEGNSSGSGGNQTTESTTKSFAEEVKDATAGTTITLSGDVSLTTTVTIDKNLTIDLNGHNIEATDCRALHITAGEVKITGNGTISAKHTDDNTSFVSASSVIRVGSGNNSKTPAESQSDVKFTVDENVTISSAWCYGITVFGSDTHEIVDIKGKVEVSGEQAAVSGNGSAGYANTDITINGTVKSTNDYAIYNPQSGSLTINGTVEGKGGIEAKAGGTVVAVETNASIKATATKQTHETNTNGTSTSGYAIAVVENKAYAGNATVEIKGGTVTGVVAILDDDDDTTNNNGKITITGGQFSVQPSFEYIASGYAASKEDNATVWTISRSDNVAMIGSTTYTSLESAISAATSENNVITLLADINTTKQIEIEGKEIVLDLKGRKIEYTGSETLSSGVLLVHNGAGLTVKGEEIGSEISAGDKAYAAIALTKKGDDATSSAKLTVESGTITGYYYAITGNGSRHSTEITINGGNIKATCTNDNLGIYHPQNGKLTISGGNITGYASAVEMRAGNLIINNGALTSSATSYNNADKDSGNTTTGAAVAIAQHNTKLPINVEIKGGTLSGFAGIDVSNPQNNDDAANVKVTISGGTINAALNGIQAGYGTVDITGGTITANKNIGVRVDAAAKVNISGATTNITSQESSVATVGTSTGCTINISGGTFTAKDNIVIAGNGTNREGEPNKFNISGGTFDGRITSSGYVACGIYAPWKDEFNITGGTFNITNGAGIVARAGMVNVSGNVSITCTGNATGKVGDSRVVVPCSPIVFDSQANYPAMTDASMITVTGGTFTSANDVSVAKAILAEGETNKRIVLLGGTYSSEPGAGYVGAGLTASKNTEGNTYTVSYEKDNKKDVATVVDEDNIDVSKGEDGSEGTMSDEEKSAAVDAIKDVVNSNSALSNVTTGADNAVDTEGTTSDGQTLTDILANAVTDVSVANKINSESATITTTVSISVKSANVNTSTGDNGTTTATVIRMEFDIKPVATAVVDDQPVASVPVPNELIKDKITFRLPVDNSVTEQYVKVFHEGVSMGYYQIKSDENNNKYIEIEAQSFSTYAYELASEVATMKAYYVGKTEGEDIDITVDAWQGILNSNPNAVAIVSEDYLAFAQENKNVLVEYVKNSVSSYVCPKFVLEDLKDFYTPVEFTAKSGEYSRQPNISRQDGVFFNSVCLPFALNHGDLSATAQLLSFTSYNESYVYFNTQDVISAGVPCLVYEDTNKSWNAITFNNTKILASPISSTNIQGTFAQRSDWANNAGYYSVNQYNKFSKLQNTLSAFRSCLWLKFTSTVSPSRAASTRGLGIVIDGNEEGTTGIDNIDAETELDNGNVYNLNGQKVNGNNLERGFYIKNNKKIIIK